MNLLQKQTPALVLAAFGARSEQDELLMTSLLHEAVKRHPDVDVFMASTSKLAAKENCHCRIDNGLNHILQTLLEQKYTAVAVQSLHVIPGREFETLEKTTAKFTSPAGGFTKTSIGAPLIHDHSSAERLTFALAASFTGSQADEAAIFVGHGSPTASGAHAYGFLQASFDVISHGFFVGTLDAQFDSDILIEKLKANGYTKARLAPLLAFSGAHAAKDIFGQKSSWRARLENSGITCLPDEAPLLARTAVNSIWLDHAALALASLGKLG